MPEKPLHLETPAEDKVSSITHGIGLLFSIVALIVLIVSAKATGSRRLLVTCSIYGVCMLMVYLASTLFHACRGGRAKHWLKVFDHVAIYCMIAGTYTPFLLVTVRGTLGWTLFGVLWGLAVAGTIFKFYFVHRYDFVSTMVYVAMGWMGVLAAGPFFHNLPPAGLWWTFAGGLAYTGGVVFYFWDHLPYNHAIWHLFVMCGSTCHFLAILYYVIP